MHQEFTLEDCAECLLAVVGFDKVAAPDYRAKKDELRIELPAFELLAFELPAFKLLATVAVLLV